LPQDASNPTIINKILPSSSYLSLPVK